MKFLIAISLSISTMFCSYHARAQDRPKSDNASGATSQDAAWSISRMSREDLHEFNELLLRGRKALQSGDTVNAKNLLKQAVTALPTDDEPRILLANIYDSENQINEEIRVLRPMIYPTANSYSAVSHMPTTRMKYVLALLDIGNWGEAVTVYEASFVGDAIKIFGQPTLASLKWVVPGYQGVAHTLPQKHFTVNDPDYTGLQAQAHLILGSREPQFVTSEEMPKYMLAHLKQALRYDPESLDAHFLSGILLDRTGKFAEARSELMKTARLAPDSAQGEIKEALKGVDKDEEKQKEMDAWNKAHPASTPPTHAQE